MSPDEAEARLFLHAGRPVPGYPEGRRPDEGLLRRLRPWRGSVDRELHEVLAAVCACAPVLQAEAIPRPLVAALWDLLRTARGWLGPDVARVRERAWLDAIEAVAGKLLDGQPVGRALLPAAKVMAELGAARLHPHVAGALAAALEDGDLEVRLAAARALGEAGEAAAPALEALRSSRAALPAPGTAPGDWNAVEAPLAARWRRDQVDDLRRALDRAIAAATGQRP